MDGMKTEYNPLLWQMEGIDTAVGLEYAGNDAELYREVLTDYADCIEEQAQSIEQALAAEDIETFTIEIHSLKSVSRSIGALELSDRAKELEEHGKRREWRPIMEKIHDLMSAYRMLYAVILPYCIHNGQERQQKLPDREAVSGLLSDLSESLEEYDSDRAEKIISELSEYDFTEHSALYMERVISAMGKFDYETCRETVVRWRRELLM